MACNTSASTATLKPAGSPVCTMPIRHCGTTPIRRRGFLPAIYAEDRVRTKKIASAAVAPTPEPVCGGAPTMHRAPNPVLSRIAPKENTAAGEKLLRTRYFLMYQPVLERWPSGRRHAPAKGADGQKLSRGFESLLLRHYPKPHLSHWLNWGFLLGLLPLCPPEIGFKPAASGSRRRRPDPSLNFAVCDV